MKRNIRFSFVPTALLSCLLAMAVVGCIATAFELTLLQGMGRVALLCGLFALAVAFTFQACHTAVPATLLLAALLLLVYQSSQQPLQLQTLLPSITAHYHNAYGWPILLEDPPMAEGADLICLRLALVICFFLCWVLARRKNLLLSLLPLSPILCCFVVYDTTPKALYLALLLSGILLLLLTHYFRRQSKTSWGALGAKLTPAVALFLALLFYLTPQTDTLNPLRSYADKLLPWIQGLIDDNAGGGNGSIVGPNTSAGVNLTTLGPKTQNNTVALYVTSTKSERTYLRHKVMMYYTGTNWHPTTGMTELFGVETRWPQDQITITTTQPRSYRYAPYFPDKALVFVDGVLPNYEKDTTYTYALNATFEPSAGNKPAAPRYTELPDTTSAWAVPLVYKLSSITVGTQQMAQAIGDYVRESASYSLDTQRMPSSQKDFAQWFLEDSDTGYCVHFATAATVLLRAAGIPAIYVEGMTFRSVAEQEVAVTNSNAHAWVEYYDSASNTWNILDPTPADGIPDDTPDSPDTPDDPDTPDNPDDPDSPDTPDDPDTPDEPDKPDDPDSPDTPAAPDTPNLPNMTPDDYAKINLWAWLTQLPLTRLMSIVGTGLAAMFLLQWPLRKRYHRRLWRKGSANQQALERFRQCSRMAKVCKLTLPEQLTELAQKARFSQYTLTQEELDCFDAFRTDVLEQMKQKHPLRRLILECIFTLT